MTTRPTLDANKSTGQTLGSTEWNKNVIQQGGWTQEVLLGTNADKIPGAALSYPLAVPDGTGSGLKIGSRARVGTVGNGLYFSNNAVSPDGGTTWNRDDTAKAAFLYAFGPQDSATGQNVTVYRAAAGANPITWVTLFDIDSAGKLTGAGIYRPAEVSIATGATATFTHGLGAKPLIVLGLYGSSTGAEQNPVGLYNSGNNTVFVNVVTSTQFTVTNTTAATVFVLMIAKL